MSRFPLRHRFSPALGRVSLGLFSSLLVSATAITAAPQSASAAAQSASAIPQSASATQAERVALGDEAIDFTMESIDGETYRLSDLRGEKSVIIIFFRGTW